jgi:hypothetical protein
MLKTIGIVAVILVSLTPADIRAEESPSAAVAPDSGGFVPVDRTQLQTVSGKSLTIAAYAVILGLLLIYAISLLRRERAVERRARATRQRLGIRDVQP